MQISFCIPFKKFENGLDLELKYTLKLPKGQFSEGLILNS